MSQPAQRTPASVAPCVRACGCPLAAGSLNANMLGEEGEEKQSLTQSQGHKEMLRRVAAHRHGEDFIADIDTTSTYTRWACGVRKKRGHTDGKH